MKDYIKTYTGIWMVPTEPAPNDFRVEDIAHALSLICRGNGQIKTFFSVGQHCINCAKEAAARGYSNRIVLACLLHDASECYLSDIPRPFKKHLTGYSELEHMMLDMINTKFLGTPPTEEEKKIIRSIDDDMLYYDLSVLLEIPQDTPEPQLKTDLSFEFRPFEEVEKEYLEMFARYSE